MLYVHVIKKEAFKEKPFGVSALRLLIAWDQLNKPNCFDQQIAVQCLSFDWGIVHSLRSSWDNC